MATINFITKDTGGTEQNLTNLGYGLGFFKDSFGTSVPVAGYSNICHITNSNGTYSGARTKHVEYTHASSGKPYGSSSGCLLTSLMNTDANLNVRFTHSSAVRVINAKFRVYDRVSIDNEPSGVSCLAAEIIHPSVTRDNTGSGDSAWAIIEGNTTIMDLANSPGSGGTSVSGSGTTEAQHDWYLALCPSPSSVGSKTFAGYVSLEWL